jgi:hypothetical protein
MGKASRRRRTPSTARTPSGDAVAAVAGPRQRAEDALRRLLRTNKPGRVSLAGAYAFGYAELGMAQQEGTAPDWYNDLDPLDTLVLGTVWPQRFPDGYDFGNARTAWLRVLRGTAHWSGIERFVHEVVAASEEHELGIDEGELMLLAMGRLEDAGLDQRRLPASLLPGAALAGSRVVVGPDPAFVLPEPLPDANSRIAAFWNSVDVALPHDGTPLDALRYGLHLFADLDLDVHADPGVLLAALYLALVAQDDEQLSDAGERAEAWAWGLAADSPLIPVIDTILTATRQELAVDTTLAHLMAVATINDQIPAADRQFPADPGTAFASLAFELGHRQVNTVDRKIVRMDAGSAELLDYQVRAFEEKFGRPPGPHDPIFFDPDADEPRPIQPVDLERGTTRMLEAAGIGPAWIYASQHTDGLLPRPDGGFNTDADRRDWNEAIDRYLRTHPDATVDHEAELGKLRTMLAISTVQMAAQDAAVGASLARRLDADELDTEADVVAEFLHWSSAVLIERLDDAAAVQAAAEVALAWSGADLAKRVRHADPEDLDLPVLLAVAVTAFATPRP